jgi:PilZ domain
VSSEQRKSPRKSVSANGFMYSAHGQPIGPCQIENVSVGGAMLRQATCNELPTQFVLSLSRNGQVRRHCEIAWQVKNRIGVRFLTSDAR